MQMIRTLRKSVLILATAFAALLYQGNVQAKVDIFSFTNLDGTSANPFSGTLTVKSNRQVLCGSKESCSYDGLIGLDYTISIPQVSSDGSITVGSITFHPDGSITGKGGGSFFINGTSPAGTGGLHSHTDTAAILTPAPEETPLTTEQLAKLQAYAGLGIQLLPFTMVWNAPISPEEVHLYHESISAPIVGSFVPCEDASDQCGGNQGFSVCGAGSWGVNQCELKDTSNTVNDCGSSGRYGKGVSRDFGCNGSGEIDIENTAAVVYGQATLQQSLGALFNLVATRLCTACGGGPGLTCPFPPPLPNPAACTAPLDVSGTLLIPFPAVDGTVVVKWDEGVNL